MKLISSHTKLIFLFIPLFFICNNQTNNLFGQNVKYVHKIVKDLAAPNMFGRTLNNNGDSIAADYIAKEFAKLKLSPINPTGIYKYYQPHTITNCVLENVSLELGSKGKLLKPDDEYYVLGFSPTSDIELDNVKPIIIADQSH